jgi:hypothetical protein
MKKPQHEGHTVRSANTGGTPVRDGKVHKGIFFFRHSFVTFVSFVFNS